MVVDSGHRRDPLRRRAAARLHRPARADAALRRRGRGAGVVRAVPGVRRRARSRRRRRRRRRALPVLRRADAHPDAPPRRPLFANTRSRHAVSIRQAADRRPTCGSRDADRSPHRRGRSGRIPPRRSRQPLAAFDPAAIPRHAEPGRRPRRRCRLLRTQVFEPSERFETFALAPDRCAARPAADAQPRSHDRIVRRSGVAIRPRRSTPCSIGSNAASVARSARRVDRRDAAEPPREHRSRMR